MMVTGLAKRMTRQRDATVPVFVYVTAYDARSAPFSTCRACRACTPPSLPLSSGVAAPAFEVICGGLATTVMLKSV